MSDPLLGIDGLGWFIIIIVVVCVIENIIINRGKDDDQ